MTLAASHRAVTRIALLGLAMLASMMALALFLAQPAGLSNMTLSTASDATVAFRVQADGYTYLPTF